MSLKGTNSAQGGYCERLELVLSNLYEETTNSKVEFDCASWGKLLNTAKTVAECVQLPLVGIDMVLELNPDKSISAYVLEVNARPGTLIFGEELIFNETGSKISWSIQSPPVNENFWSYVSGLALAELGDKQLPKNLLEWKCLILREQVDKMDKRLEKSAFVSLLKKR